jgi:hypothetical protein
MAVADGPKGTLLVPPLRSSQTAANHELLGILACLNKFMH